MFGVAFGRVIGIHFTVFYGFFFGFCDGAQNELRLVSQIFNDFTESTTTDSIDNFCGNGDNNNSETHTQKCANRCDPTPGEEKNFSLFFIFSFARWVEVTPNQCKYGIWTRKVCIREREWCHMIIMILLEKRTRRDRNNLIGTTFQCCRINKIENLWFCAADYWWGRTERAETIEPTDITISTSGWQVWGKNNFVSIGSRQHQSELYAHSNWLTGLVINVYRSVE